MRACDKCGSSKLVAECRFLCSSASIIKDLCSVCQEDIKNFINAPPGPRSPMSVMQTVVEGMKIAGSGMAQASKSMNDGNAQDTRSKFVKDHFNL